MLEIEIQKSGVMPIGNDSSKKPDIVVLDKTMEVLKKAGFPEDAVGKVYDMLKGYCGEDEKSGEADQEEKMSMPESKSGDSKDMMMNAMKAFMEKLASK